MADTKTSAVDVVTEADRAVEELIRARHRRARGPTTRSSARRATTVPAPAGVRWVVDPIDGTVNYLYGLPDYAVSIAAEVDGEVVAGRRGHDPDRRGVRRRPRARRHPRRRSRSRYGPSPPLAERLVLTGFGYQREVREHQARCVAALLPEVRDIRRHGLVRARPVPRRGGERRRLRRGGPAAVGLRRRRPGAARGRRSLRAARRHVHLGAHPVRNVVVGAPADGWDDFVAALAEAGFLA